ncbi:NUDIX domain-containing protein [Streptomyces axinellae]
MTESATPPESVTPPGSAMPPEAVAPASAPLATGPRGMRLLSFHREPEGTRFEDAPVGYALVAVRHEGRLLMVYERDRECWELPGGSIEEGESPRAAAVRELREETCQVTDPAALRFVGFSRTALGARQRILYGALFTGELTRVLPFVANSEISDIHWRAGEEPLPFGQTQTVDEYLVKMCAE